MLIAVTVISICLAMIIRFRSLILVHGGLSGDEESDTTYLELLCLLFQVQNILEIWP